MTKKRISEAYPDHKCGSLGMKLMGRFIGEETYSGGQESVLDDAPTWIVDPIDGISNGKW